MVEAPGYESRRVDLRARAPGDARSGPEEIELTPLPSAPLGKLILTLRSSEPATHVSVVVRTGNRVALRDILRMERSVEFSRKLSPGEYVATIGGNDVGTIRIEASRESTRTVYLDQLPALVYSLRSGGAPYSGAAGVMMRESVSTPGPWNCGFSDVMFRGGRSARFVVPPGSLLVAVSLPDGRHKMGTVTAIAGKVLEAKLEIE